MKILKKYQCEQCSVGFLKKWLLAKHIKEIHLEEKRNYSFGKNYDQPPTEDQVKHNICNQESAIESAIKMIFLILTNRPKRVKNRIV